LLEVLFNFIDTSNISSQSAQEGTRSGITGLLASRKLQHLVLRRCQRPHLIAIYGDSSGWSNPICVSAVPSSPYYVDGQPHPDWLGGNSIVISGTGGEIDYQGSGDVEMHESTNVG